MLFRSACDEWNAESASLSLENTLAANKESDFVIYSAIKVGN